MDFVAGLGFLSLGFGGSRALVRIEPTMAPIIAVTVPTTIVSLLREKNPGFSTPSSIYISEYLAKLT